MKRFVCKYFCSFTLFKNTIWNINNISYFVEIICLQIGVAPDLIFSKCFFLYFVRNWGSGIGGTGVDYAFKHRPQLCSRPLHQIQQIQYQWEMRKKYIKKHMCLHVFYCCKESKLINMQLHNAKRLGVLGGTMWIKYFAQRWSSSFFCCSIQYPAHGTCHTSCHFNRKGYHPQRIVKPIILTGSLE